MIFVFKVGLFYFPPSLLFGRLSFSGIFYVFPFYPSCAHTTVKNASGGVANKSGMKRKKLKFGDMRIGFLGRFSLRGQWDPVGGNAAGFLGLSLAQFGSVWLSLALGKF